MLQFICPQVNSLAFVLGLSKSGDDICCSRDFVMILMMSYKLTRQDMNLKQSNPHQY